MKGKILFHGGGNALSNMAAYAVEWRSEVWMTVEHAYQSAKFTDPTIVDNIRKARSAYDAKRIADESVQFIRTDWLDKRLAVMEELVCLKTNQHSHIQMKLLNSGTDEIIEDTDDSFWGRGENGSGQNNLGKLWMKMRDELTHKAAL